MSLILNRPLFYGIAKNNIEYNRNFKVESVVGRVVMLLVAFGDRFCCMAYVSALIGKKYVYTYNTNLKTCLNYVKIYYIFRRFEKCYRQTVKKSFYVFIFKVKNILYESSHVPVPSSISKTPSPKSIFYHRNEKKHS